MAAPAVVSLTKISASDIQFADPKRNKDTGAVSVGLKYNNQNVQFRLPRVSFPGGLTVKQNTNKDGSVTTSYVLRASLPGGDPYGKERSSDTSDTAKLYNFLFDFQEHLIKTAVKNSPKWFGKTRSEDSIRDSLNRFLSLSVDKTENGWEPNGKYPPSLQMKLPVYGEKIALEVIDDADNDVPLTLDNLTKVFTKGSSATTVVSAQVYISGQGFGITFKPSYAQVQQRKKMTARDFFKCDEDDKEESAAAKPADEEDEEEEVEQKEEEEVVVDVPPAPQAAPPTLATGHTQPAPEKAPARRRKVA